MYLDADVIRRPVLHFEMWWRLKVLYYEKPFIVSRTVFSMKRGSVDVDLIDMNYEWSFRFLRHQSRMMWVIFLNLLHHPMNRISCWSFSKQHSRLQPQIRFDCEHKIHLKFPLRFIAFREIITIEITVFPRCDPLLPHRIRRRRKNRNWETMKLEWRLVPYQTCRCSFRSSWFKSNRSLLQR